MQAVANNSANDWICIYYCNRKITEYYIYIFFQLLLLLNKNFPPPNHLPSDSSSVCWLCCPVSIERTSTQERKLPLLNHFMGSLINSLTRGDCRFNLGWNVWLAESTFRGEWSRMCLWVRYMYSIHIWYTVLYMSVNCQCIKHWLIISHELENSSSQMVAMG